MNDVRVFVRRDLEVERKTNSTLDLLIKDFKKYKAGATISYFGKDVPYHEPRPYAERAKLRHVHILDRLQTVRVRQSGNASDSVLIYTAGSMTPNTYYILDYLADKAHAEAQRHEYMAWIIEKAESFRMKF